MDHGRLRWAIISSLQKRRPCLLVTIQSHAPRSPYTSCTVHGASVDLSQSFCPTPGLCCCSLALSTPRECRPKGTTPDQTKYDKTISEKIPKLGQTWLIVSQSKQVPLSRSRTIRLFSLLGCPPWVTRKTANDLIHCRCKQIKNIIKSHWDHFISFSALLVTQIL